MVSIDTLTQALELCSWNIHMGRDRERLLESIRACRRFDSLDLLLLQEASQDHRQSDGQMVAGALGPDYSWHQRAVDSFHGRVRGLAVIWNRARIAVEGFEVVPLPQLRHSTVAPRHRYPLHPLRLRRRVSLLFTGRVAKRRLRAYNVHLSPVGFNFQIEQLTTLLRHDEALDGSADLSVMAGDFNSLRIDRRRWAAWFNRLQTRGFVDATGDVPWTFRTFRSPVFPVRQKLDNVLLKSAHTLQHACWSEDVGGSDHIPIFVRVSW